MSSVRTASLSSLTERAFQRSLALFWPATWANWWRLAVIGMLSGELASYGANVTGRDQEVEEAATTSVHHIAAAIPVPKPQSLWETLDYHSFQQIPVLLQDNRLELTAISLIAGLFFLLYAFIVSRFVFILLDTCQSGIPRIKKGFKKYARAANRLLAFRLCLYALYLMWLLSWACAAYGWIDSLYALTPDVDFEEFYEINRSDLLSWLFIFIGTTVGLGLLTLLVLFWIKDYLIPIMAFTNKGFWQSVHYTFMILRTAKKEAALYLFWRILMSLVVVFGVSMIGFFILVGFFIVGGLIALLTWGSISLFPLLKAPAVIAGTAIGIGYFFFVMTTIFAIFSFGKIWMRNLSLEYLSHLSHGIFIPIASIEKSVPTKEDKNNNESKVCF